MYELHVLFNGYSMKTKEGQKANCTCSLLKGNVNIIIDTMTPWDKDKILEELSKLQISPSDINYVICTHGHSDHTGNNNLFLNAKHIVGQCISHKDIYFDHDFENFYQIDEDISVLPTAGHTLSCVSVLAKNVKGLGTVGIVGDLFECVDDLECDDIWIEAGSENVELQRKNRDHMLSICDWIVPGHGKIFPVNKNNTHS